MDVCLFWMLCGVRQVSALDWLLVLRSHTVCGVSECDREALIMRRPCPARGSCAIGKKSCYAVIKKRKRQCQVEELKCSPTHMVFKEGWEWEFDSHPVMLTAKLEHCFNGYILAVVKTKCHVSACSVLRARCEQGTGDSHFRRTVNHLKTALSVLLYAWNRFVNRWNDFLEFLYCRIYQN